MEPLEKLLLMRELDGVKKSRRVRLNVLGIPKSTYYDWRRKYARDVRLEGKVDAEHGQGTPESRSNPHFVDACHRQQG